jgi:hypothetical protein
MAYQSISRIVLAHWTQCWMGLTTSPFMAVHFYYFAEEFARGNHAEPTNALKVPTLFMPKTSLKVGWTMDNGWTVGVMLNCSSQEGKPVLDLEQ